MGGEGAESVCVDYAPLDDVWKRIALYSYPDHLRTVFSASGLSPEEKTALEGYATTRIRQAIEFRSASQTGTLLTAPLPLYYAFLNLTRAFLALDIERRPSTNHHGLVHTGGSTVLESTATVKDGTFLEWMNALGATVSKGDVISLDACVSGIIEVGADYFAVTGRSPRCVPIYVQAMTSGAVTLRFDGNRTGNEQHFRDTWKTEYPSLASVCSPEPEGVVLRVNPEVDTKTYEAVCEFCSQHLEVNLVPMTRPTWHLFRRESGAIHLPRAAYYFCASFILGSIVRYEPENLMTLIAEPSSVAWLLDRFLKAAERFYPNLMLNWTMKRPWFFGAVSE